MSESESEQDGISDEDLPEDLQPGEDNPLAEPVDTDEVDRDDLDLYGGKTPEESDGDSADGEPEDRGDSDGGGSESEDDDEDQ